MEPVVSGAVDLVGSGAQGWRDAAACLHEDPELFFPEGESERYRLQIAAALEVCATCEVAGPCLRYALEADQRTGIWGGTTADERRGLAVVAGQVLPIRRGHTGVAVTAAAMAEPVVPSVVQPVVPPGCDGAAGDLQRAAG